MISDLRIKNFKSVADLSMNFARMNLLIGENGCGKSNILEALAFASAAANEKLDNEFLVSRGIRVTEPQFMRSAFSSRNNDDPIEIRIAMGDVSLFASLQVEGAAAYAKWKNNGGFHFEATPQLEDLVQQLHENGNPPNALDVLKLPAWKTLIERTAALKDEQLRQTGLKTFLIYSPENTALRTFEREGQILPLGIQGEGLFRLLKVLSDEQHQEQLADIKENLKLLDWFQDFRMPLNVTQFEQTLEIGDRYLHSDLAYFDQRSANEGFLFLLFYFALFVSPDTPPFFAIDNVDASLNPKLCSEMVSRLVALAEKYDKQVIMTTHNPAVLDGLNLHDDEQRLFVVSRNNGGATRVRRVSPPKPVAGEPPARLSEAFLRGHLGGLPQNF